MKRAITVFLILTFLTACGAKTYQPVASMEELCTKETRDMRRDWVEGADRKTAGLVFVQFVGGVILSVPVTILMLNARDEKNQTPSQLADVIAVKTYEDNWLRNLLYSDGVISYEYGVFGFNGALPKDDDGVRPLLLCHVANGEEKKIYCEARIIKADDEAYWTWSIPLLKKNENGDLVYALDDRYRIKGPIKIGELLTIPVTNPRQGGEIIIKRDTDILPEIKAHFVKNGIDMKKLKARTAVAELKVQEVAK